VAGKKERQRRLERERYQRRLERQAHRDQRARQVAVGAVVAIIVLAVIAGVFFLVRPTGGHAAASAPVTHCSYTSSPPASRNVGTPPTTPDTSATYRATINTNRGAIVINLRNSKAPCTVNSFIYLAAKKFFNTTPCQRLTTSGIFVLQCGDPTGTGSGGPGYKFNDENLTGATYPAGTVAMANSGANTNGSQFFLVYQNSSSGLSPAYTPFGTIVSGLNIIQNVAKAGSDNSNGPGDGHPKEKVEIESVTIKKS
jgi:peptidyl-prolyl cis-trans isomerase B (cyclophilin B)